MALRFGMSEVAMEPYKRVAPYLPFATFLSSLDAFSQGVPPKLDRTLWRSQSGFMQGLIMNAYRFFGLVEDDDSANDYLVVLVQKKEQRPETMRELIEAQYSEVLDGHDLSKMTMKMLESEFERAFAVSGATKQKAITFFLKAAKFAVMPLSSFLSSQLRNAAPKKRKTNNKQRVEERTQDDEISDDLPADSTGAVTHTVQLESGGTVSVIVTANPFAMALEDRNFVFSMIDMVQKYESRKHAEK
jgi:hypothetical protein